MTSDATLKAIKLLASLGIQDPTKTSIEDLIIYNNGIVKRVALNNCDGRMVMKNGRSIVSLNANIEYPKKERFVLAHELGHILLHGGKEATFSDDYRTLEAYKHGAQEKEANDFATELLMPAEMFRTACFRQKFGAELLRNLSEKFNTSITSVAYRYIDIGQHPICVFYSKDKKIQYSKKSEQFHYWVPDRNRLNIPGDSVAEEFYSKGRIYVGKDSDQSIVKSTWFELGKYDSDTPMFEFCIVTRNHNTVLSIVWEK